MAQVRWAQQAVSDLESLHRYYTDVAPAAADKLIRRLVDSVVVLERHERIGRQVPETGRDDIRELIVTDHRVIYRLTPPLVEIIAVIHSRRDFPRRTEHLGE